MVFAAVKYLIVGVLCIVLGLFVWKKHMLSTIHSPYYDKVSPENIPAYMSLTGFGVILIGIGICLTGLLNFVTKSYLMRLPALAGMLAGFIFINKAQREYNRSGL